MTNEERKALFEADRQRQIKGQKALLEEAARRRARYPDTYLLSAAGKAVLWEDWHEQSGCGVSNHFVPIMIGALGLPVSRWPATLTLGDIQRISLTEARHIARFSREHMGHPEWTEREYPENYDKKN